MKKVLGLELKFRTTILPPLEDKKKKHFESIFRYENTTE
jgi:hypothetical protein